MGKANCQWTTIMENKAVTTQLEREAVAVQMIRLEARTRTIRLATRLTEDQIRRLYRQARLGAADKTPRHRGRSPTQALQYTRNLTTQLEASILAGVLAKHGMLRGRRDKPWLSNSVHYAQRFCVAYDDYLPLALQQPLNFEQAWHFARSLAARTELYLQRCARCASHFVRDTATVLKSQCPFCRLREQAPRTR
jgi:hypothetical protein